MDILLLVSKNEPKSFEGALLSLKGLRGGRNIYRSSPWDALSPLCSVDEFPLAFLLLQDCLQFITNTAQCKDQDLVGLKPRSCNVFWRTEVQGNVS